MRYGSIPPTLFDKQAPCIPSYYTDAWEQTLKSDQSVKARNQAVLHALAGTLAALSWGCRAASRLPVGG